MARRGGGFGLVLLVVVIAVVLVLAARGWREATPLVLDTTHPTAASVPPGQADASAALEGLPGLDDLRRGADAHARDVSDAIERID